MLLDDWLLPESLSLSKDPLAEYGRLDTDIEPLLLVDAAESGRLLLPDAAERGRPPLADADERGRLFCLLITIGLSVRFED